MLEILDQVSEKMERKVTDVQRVVNAFKEAKGIHVNDKAWDRRMFGRCAKPAKSILECFNGDWQRAVLYVLAKGAEYQEVYINGQPMGWTLETIERDAWNNERGKVNEQLSKQMGPDQLPTGGGLKLPPQGGKPGVSSAGSLADDALERLRRNSGEARPNPLLANENDRGPESD